MRFEAESRAGSWRSIGAGEVVAGVLWAQAGSENKAAKARIQLNPVILTRFMPLSSRISSEKCLQNAIDSRAAFPYPKHSRSFALVSPCALILLNLDSLGGQRDKAG